MLKDIISLESEANILIMSDPGFGPLNKCFYINTWFQEKGFLSEDQGKLYRLLSKLGLTYNRIVSILLRFKLYRFIVGITPQSIKTEVPIFMGEPKTDYNNSCAFINTINGGVYINNSDLLLKIINRLKSCRIKGETPIQSINMRDEVWWGPYARNAPDIILTPEYGYEISPRHVPSTLEKPEKFGDTRTGTHRPEGIFIAHGPDIRKNYKIDHCIQTWDIVPTLLFMLDKPIPSYMDGRVIKKIFRNV